jgi:hypothetical protein
MIQIPEKLKSENIIIEPTEQNDNNEIIKNPIKMSLNHYTIKEIRNLFFIEYKTMFKRDFQMTKESKELLYTILCYFFKDEHFFSSPLLIIPQGTTPSLDKGFLIMGNCGTGKTSILLALEQVFNKHVIFNSKIHFKSMTVNAVVNEYEKLKSPEEREEFNRKHQGGFRLYDDVKSEDDASNFGKKNTIKIILFLRNSKGSKTILTCNYDPAFPNDFEKGIDQFGLRYDERIYDRLHSDFNFIEARGKSLRG